LLDKSQNWLALKGDKPHLLKREINEFIAKSKYGARKNAIIVDGFQLTMIQGDEEL